MSGFTPAADDLLQTSSGVIDVDFLMLDRYLPYQLLYVTSRITEIYDKRYKEELGITIPESRVIHVLARYPNISSREVCLMTTLSKSGVSLALQRLEAAGLLLRRANTSDQRLVTVTFTKKGNALRKKLVKLALEMEAHIVRFMGKARAGSLMDTLERLSGYSEQAPTSPQRQTKGAINELQLPR